MLYIYTVMAHPDCILPDDQMPQLLDESLSDALSPSHARRLQSVHKSAGWPCCDSREVDLMAAGLLERRRSALGHETVHVTAKGLVLIGPPIAEASAELSPRDALVQRVAREMTRNGRFAWCGLRLRIELAALEEGGEEGRDRWCLAQPDVFSIRNTSVESYAQPIVHHVMLERTDLVAHLGEADVHAIYHELGGELWYVLGHDMYGVPIAEPQEIPKEYGVLVRENNRLVVMRSAMHRARARMPFGVWLALAKAQPIRGMDHGAQGLLTEVAGLEPGSL